VPYRDPERKRQWEREHREERNARRRKPDVRVRVERILHKPTPDRVAEHKPTSGWTVLLGFAVGLGVVVIAAVAGVNLPPAGALGGLPGSGSSTERLTGN
jgi:hypothetical protein